MYLYNVRIHSNDAFNLYLHKNVLLLKYAKYVLHNKLDAARNMPMCVYSLEKLSQHTQTRTNNKYAYKSVHLYTFVHNTHVCVWVCVHEQNISKYTEANRVYTEPDLRRTAEHISPCTLHAVQRTACFRITFISQAFPFSPIYIQHTCMWCVENLCSVKKFIQWMHQERNAQFLCGKKIIKFSPLNHDTFPY